MARLLGGDIETARSSFRRAIDLLHGQGRVEEVLALQRQAQAFVKLDAETAA